LLDSLLQEFQTNNYVVDENELSNSINLYQ